MSDYTIGIDWAGADGVVGHVRSLPHADQVQILRALLRACPEAAVEAVDSCKVARAWRLESDHGGIRWTRGTAALVAEVQSRPYAGRDAGKVLTFWRITADNQELEPTSRDAQTARAAADAALLAAGWVLAGEVTRAE